jgi:hypothetical protein
MSKKKTLVVPGVAEGTRKDASLVLTYIEVLQGDNAFMA